MKLISVQRDNKFKYLGSRIWDKTLAGFFNIFFKTYVIFYFILDSASYITIACKIITDEKEKVRGFIIKDIES